MDAGCAFVNCLPVFIASDPEWAQKFRDAGVPIVGDDIKSQVGATITHRVMARLFEGLYSRLSGTSPNVVPSRRTNANLRSSSHAT